MVLSNIDDTRKIKYGQYKQYEKYRITNGTRTIEILGISKYQ